MFYLKLIEIITLATESILGVRVDFNEKGVFLEEQVIHFHNHIAGFLLTFLETDL